jgi:hypothetical protein
MSSHRDLPRLREETSYPKAVIGHLVEGKRSVRGRLSVGDSSGSSLTYINIAEGGGPQIKAKWPDGVAVSPLIDPEETYQVELLTRVYTDPDYVFDDVLRVSDKDGRVIVDASICCRHGLAMQRQVEEGMSAEDYPDSFDKRREKEFPNDGKVYLACGSGIQHMTWKCPECDKRYHAWAKRNGTEE